MTEATLSTRSRKEVIELRVEAEVDNHGDLPETFTRRTRSFLCLFSSVCSVSWREAASVVKRLGQLRSRGHSSIFTRPTSVVPPFPSGRKISVSPSATSDALGKARAMFG